MTRKLSITIAIAAYNAENNISVMLSALTNQVERGFVTKQIIVHDDCSQDQTTTIAKKVKSSKIKVVRGQKRKGFAGTVKYLLKNYISDIVIILNDDIIIDDNQFIAKVVSEFSHPKVGLVSGYLQPLPPQTFVEKAINSSTNAYNNMRYRIREGHNKFSCDGKILGLSKQFVSEICYPKELGLMGNVDAYLYFECLVRGYNYRHARYAKAYYRLPQTYRDYLSWFIRNNANRYLLKKSFGEIVDREYKLPLTIYYYQLRELIKNPLGCIFVWLTGWYIKLSAKYLAKRFNPLWKPVDSSKSLLFSK